MANHEGWHGKAMSHEQAAQAIEELGGIRSLTVTPLSSPEIKPLVLGELRAEPAPTYPEPIATRKAFGETLAWLAGHRPDLVVLDGEVGNSTHTEDFQAVAPERFLEMYIAEQAVIGAQTGLQALGKTPFAATFGAFLTRAYDQVRMGAISRANLRLCGSHAGVSIGEDGPSQMALEDLAMFRALHSSTVLYPADGNATVELVTAMCDLPGISYIRTTREATPALYGADEEFPIGGSKTLRTSDDDKVTLVGAGVTVRECLEAAETLAGEGIAARVIDAYSVKPIDGSTMRRAIEDTGLLVVVEDHRVEGGLGDAVLDALAESGPLAGTVVQARRARDAGIGHPAGDAGLGGHRRDGDRPSGTRGPGAAMTCAIRLGSGASRTDRHSGHAGHAAEGERDDLLGRHGLREQEALPEQAPALAQEGELLGRLDALGQRRHAEATGELEERADDARPIARRHPRCSRTSGRSSARRPASHAAATATSTRCRSRRSRSAGLRGAGPRGSPARDRDPSSPRSP